MKALVKLLETLENHPSETFPHDVGTARREARDELNQINADAESARNDPSDSVGGLYKLAEIMRTHGVIGGESWLERIAEEIIYLRQRPAVIAYCDERIDELEQAREQAGADALAAKADELEFAGWTKQQRGDRAGSVAFFDAAAMCRLGLDS